jgi:hypothetical protein
MGGIPVGDYQQGRMANIGINPAPFDKTQGYGQFKTHWEWGAQSRPSGWNLSLSVLLPLGG